MLLFGLLQKPPPMQTGHMGQRSGDSLAQGGEFGDRQRAGSSDRREWDDLFHDIEASRREELTRPQNENGQDQQACLKTSRQDKTGLPLRLL